jgi:FAD/FMN-containing dehydrogenase
MSPRGPDWAVLQDRLSGRVLLPGSDAYERARKPFIARFDEVRPQAVVRCETAEDIAEVISFARRRGIETAPRSGGHSLAGYSTTPGIVVDVSPIDAVVVADGVVRVGAGARTGDLSLRLFEHGLAIPTGTCPSVGIAGLTLGGGIGMLGRAYGLTLDRLVAARVVLADGSLVDCSADEQPDLFWALRGAGARNFGVVSSFTFDPVVVPPRLGNFHLRWPYEDATAVATAWQAWSPGGPDELSADLVLSAPADARAEPAVEVFGAFLGAADGAAELLADLEAQVGSPPRARRCTELSYGDSCAFQAEVSVAYDLVEDAGRGERRLRQGHRLTKSQLFARPLPADAIAELADLLVRERRPGEARSVGFAPWGGAYNRRSPQATAFAHRDQLFSVEHIATVAPPASASAKRGAREWVTASWSSVRAASSPAVYPGFPDPDLDDWARAYYGDNYSRLVAVKQAYDPHGVFRFEQGIPGEPAPEAASNGG